MTVFFERELNTEEEWDEVRTCGIMLYMIAIPDVISNRQNCNICTEAAMFLLFIVILSSLVVLSLRGWSGWYRIIQVILSIWSGGPYGWSGY